MGHILFESGKAEKPNRNLCIRRDIADTHMYPHRNKYTALNVKSAYWLEKYIHFASLLVASIKDNI